MKKSVMDNTFCFIDYIEIYFDNGFKAFHMSQTDIVSKYVHFFISFFQ